MSRIWIALLLVIGAIPTDPASAQASRRCNLDRIQAQLANSDSEFPSLIGCKPEDVRPILQERDYGLTIEGRAASDTVRDGRIVRQRLGDGYVYVDVSTGPPPRPQDERDDQTGAVVGQIIGGILTAVTTPPPPGARPPAPEPDREPHPALVSVLTIPVATPPMPSPTVVEPTPTPPVIEPPPLSPVVQPPAQPATAPATQRPAQLVAQASPPAPPVQSRPEPLPVPPETAPSLVPAEVIPAKPVVTNPPAAPPPPVARFSLSGSASAGEGDELVLTIRREERDGADHRIALGYSDPYLLVSPPTEFDFKAGMPDEMRLRLRTVAIADGDGDQQLVIRLASAGRAEVRQPDAVMALILDRTPWWKKLLRAIASVPIWAAILAAAALAAGVAGLAFMLAPRATCSIGKGSVDLGAGPLKSRWPAMNVDTAIGDPSFSIPSPLPIGRRRNAEPSPA